MTLTSLRILRPTPTSSHHSDFSIFSPSSAISASRRYSVPFSLSDLFSCLCPVEPPPLINWLSLDMRHFSTVAQVGCMIWWTDSAISQWRRSCASLSRASVTNSATSWCSLACPTCSVQLQCSPRSISHGCVSTTQSSGCRTSSSVRPKSDESR